MSNLHPRKKDNPRLLQKQLSDGRISLYLEYYLGYSKTMLFDEVTGQEIIDEKTGKAKFKIKHKRKKETLGYYLLKNPRTPEEREKNRVAIVTADSIRQKREDELKSKKLNIEDKNKAKINFIDYCIKFQNEYTNKDIRLVKYCVKYFKEFVIKETGKEYILPVDINEKFALRFKSHLEDKLNGETPYNYFTKFKKICKEAFNYGLPISNRVLDVRNHRNEGLKKDILSVDEIQTLANTFLKNDNIKRAFLFSLNTGLRFCDIQNLQWKNINDNQIIIKSQQKTGKPVYIDLNPTAKALLNEKGKADEKVFQLPSMTGCLKALKSWTGKAGIEKHITWHSARHSFAVNLLIYKNDIKTVSSLLGHAGLKHTEKYTRVVDELKNKAVNSLPGINF